MRIRAAWGHDGKKPRKIFNLRSDNKTEDGEVLCETRLSFLSQKAQLLKKSFLFYTKNTNQTNKGTN